MNNKNTKYGMSESEPKQQLVWIPLKGGMARCNICYRTTEHNWYALVRDSEKDTLAEQCFPHGIACKDCHLRFPKDLEKFLTDKEKNLPKQSTTDKGGL